MNKYLVTFQRPDSTDEVFVTAYCDKEQGAPYFAMQRAKVLKLFSMKETTKGVKIKKIELLEENVDLSKL